LIDFQLPNGFIIYTMKLKYVHLLNG